MIDSYDKLPVGTYVEALAIARDYDGEERNLRLLSLLSGESIDDLMDRPFVEVGTDMKRLAFLAKEPTPQKTRKEYHVGPFTLVPTLDYKKVTTAQYVDFQGFTKEPSEDGHVVEVLSCFLVPKGATYCDGSYDPADVQKAVREAMCVADAASLHAFFFGRYSASMRRLLTSLTAALSRLPESPQKEALQAKATSLRTALQRAGDGSPAWTPFRLLSGLLGTTSGR